MPFISVVIPTFNRRHALQAALGSVLAQTYADFEVVVVDDGSTDGTAESVSVLVHDQDRGRQPPRPIRYVYQPNAGQSAARNSGCAAAQGTWISFLDSDDTWLPEKLEMQVRALDRWGEGCRACFTDARLVDSAGLDITAFARAGTTYADESGQVPDLVQRLARGFGDIWLQTLMARRDLVEQIGGFDASLRFAEDHDFLFRLALVTPFVYVNRPLAVIERTSRVFDPNAQARLWDKVEIRLRGEQHRLEKWLRLEGGYSPEIRNILRWNLRGVHSSWANWHLEGNRFAQARASAAEAVRCYFTPQSALKWALTASLPSLAKRIVPCSAQIL